MATNTEGMVTHHDNVAWINTNRFAGFDTFTVDDDAVSRSEIFDVDVGPIDSDPRMFAAHADIKREEHFARSSADHSTVD